MEDGFELVCTSARPPAVEIKLFDDLLKKKKFSTGVFSFFVFWESELACHLADTYVGLTGIKLLDFWHKAVGCWLIQFIW